MLSFFVWGGEGEQNLLDNGFEVSQSVSKIKMFVGVKINQCVSKDVN